VALCGKWGTLKGLRKLTGTPREMLASNRQGAEGAGLEQNVAVQSNHRARLNVALEA
jgi:hypothetical protein